MTLSPLNPSDRQGVQLNSSILKSVPINISDSAISADSVTSQNPYSDSVSSATLDSSAISYTSTVDSVDTAPLLGGESLSTGVDIAQVGGEFSQNALSSVSLGDMSSYRTSYYENTQITGKDGEKSTSTRQLPARCRFDTKKTTITPLVGGESIFPMARKMIKQAKESIAVQMYNFSVSRLSGWEKVPGRTDEQHFKDQDALIDELVAASKRGVKVQVVLDSSKDLKGNMMNWQTEEYLKKHKIEVIRYPIQTVHIDHVKLLVVDGRRAMIGGMNWGEHSPANHDANILVEGREAAEIKEYVFDSSVRFSGKKPSKTEVHPNREEKIQVLVTRPVEHDGGASDIAEALITTLDSAEKNIYVQLFCLTEKSVIKSLIDAHNRGVDVRILLDPNMYLINRNAFEELAAADVPVRWYTVDVKAEEKLHGKWATVDGEKLMIGSANWSRRGLVGGKPGDRTNHEANVLVTDSDTSDYFEKVFLKDWKDRSSVELPPRKWMF